MKIGLFPSKKHSINSGVNTIHLPQNDTVKDQLFPLAEGIKGNQQVVDLGGAMVVLRDLKLKNSYSKEVSNANFCFGLHFLLEGSCSFRGREQNRKIKISEGFYNLVQWPPIYGLQKLKGTAYISVEVFCTKQFLKEMLGAEFDIVFQGFKNVLGAQPKCFWIENQAISYKIKSQLLEILYCPYTGSSKKHYISGQTRCLLINALLRDGNGTVQNIASPSTSLDKEAVEKVVLYINQNLKKKLTIKGLSEIAGFNTTKLKHSFKKIYQTTIFKYITHLRMEKAKTLVLKNNLSIAQASYEVGYANPQHFTVAFKKTMGYLPSVLREHKE